MEECGYRRKQAYRAEVAYSNAQQDLMIRVVNAYFQALQARDDLSFAEAEKKPLNANLNKRNSVFR